MSHFKKHVFLQNKAARDEENTTLVVFLYLVTD